MFPCLYICKASICVQIYLAKSIIIILMCVKGVVGSFSVWHNFRSENLWSHELPHCNPDSLLKMKSKQFSTVKLCSFMYVIRDVFCGGNNKIEVEMNLRFLLHRYNEMLIFLKWWTHTEECINSWKTTNIKNVFVCRKLDWQRPHSSLENRRFGFGQRGVKILPLPAGDAELEKSVRKCSEGEHWEMLGCAWTQKGKKLCGYLLGWEMPSFLLLLWVWCWVNTAYFQVKNYTLCSL